MIGVQLSIIHYTVLGYVMRFPLFLRYLSIEKKMAETEIPRFRDSQISGTETGRIYEKVRNNLLHLI